MNVSEADLYKMLKIVEKHADEPAKLDPSFRQIAGRQDGRIQKQALQSDPELVPIDPGLAKFLKEKGSGTPSGTATSPRPACKA